MDCLFIVHIFMQLTTAIGQDEDMVTDFLSILKKYAKESLIFDLISTIPTLVTWYSIP